MSSQAQSNVGVEVGKFIKELDEEYVSWYINSVKRVSFMYGSLQLISLLAGFGTSILIALLGGSPLTFGTKTVLVCLPALGSLAATVLIQFRVYDLMRLREEGRIKVENLVAVGKRTFAASKNEQEFISLHQQLQESIHEIESDQSIRFFGLTKPDFVSKFPNGPRDNST